MCFTNASGVDESFSDLFGRVVGDWMTPMLSGSSYHPNSIRDTQDEGQELYLHFFHEQLRGEGIDESALEEERWIEATAWARKEAIDLIPAIK